MLESVVFFIKWKGEVIARVHFYLIPAPVQIRIEWMMKW